MDLPLTYNLVSKIIIVLTSIKLRQVAVTWLAERVYVSLKMILDTHVFIFKGRITILNSNIPSGFTALEQSPTVRTWEDISPGNPVKSDLSNNFTPDGSKILCSPEVFGQTQFSDPLYFHIYISP